MPCPACHGFGFIRIEPYDAPDGQNIEPRDVDCTRCAGSGEVDAPALDATSAPDLESASVYASALRLVSSPEEKARAARYMAQLIPHVNMPAE